MGKENKINYGLKNVYYSLVTIEEGNTVCYGTPVPIRGAVSASFKKNFEKTAVPADDDPEYAVVIDNKGYDGELEATNLPQSFYTDCLGQKVEGDTIVESKDDKPSYFALLFEFDGDVMKRRHVLYNCLASPHDIESSTKGEKVEAKTVKLSLSATPAKDTGHIKRSTIKADGDVYNNWFVDVQISGGEAL